MLFAKAVAPALPLVGSLPGVRHSGVDAPGLTLLRERVRTDPQLLADYAAVCGLRLGDTLPITYPHVAAFGLQLALVTDSTFPFAALGVVHVANSIVQHRPLRLGETFDVRVHATNLRAHPKGRLIDVVTLVRAGNETVWEETMTLLHRERADADVADTLPLRDLDPPIGPTRWRIAADIGRRYASVSGDRNPIHLYGLTARAFGFPRQIAHGMWTTARCVAALEGRLPDAMTLRVAFRKPVLLPATVAFGYAADTAGGAVFGLTSAGGATPHLVGTVSR
jgi:acyl dehydratase